jgi:hypothetical protein
MKRAHKTWLLAATLASALAGASLALGAATDDHAATQAIVDQLEHDAAHKAVVADTVAHAKAALERATRMRTAGDEAHARLADGLAREWAETAADLVRAVDAEKRAADARHEALDAGAQLERERALLEEGVTRAGRLRAELAAAEKEAKDTHRTVPLTPDAGAPKGRRPR